MRLASALSLALLLLPALALAQGGIGALPLVVDMRKVEVGSWSEYETSSGGKALPSRWALVARDDRSSTLEVTSRDPRTSKQVVLRTVLPPDPTDKPPKPTVIQVGDEPPMLERVDTPAQFRRPDKQNLVGKEEIKVAAGAFKTAHYREKKPIGMVDVWVSETIFPIGLVKLVVTSQADMGREPIVMELTATGKGAKPLITREPQPYDEKKLRGH
jgi:hypothetical protein